jgi:hypothetical protein
MDDRKGFQRRKGSRCNNLILQQRKRKRKIVWRQYQMVWKILLPLPWKALVQLILLQLLLCWKAFLLLLLLPQKALLLQLLLPQKALLLLLPQKALLLQLLLPQKALLLLL